MNVAVCGQLRRETENLTDTSAQRLRRSWLWPVAATVLVVLGLAWIAGRLFGLSIVHSDGPYQLEHAETAAAPPLPVADSADVIAPTPKNVVVLVADGLGFAHLAAARAVLHGIDGAAAWDRFPATGWHRPHPVRGFLTDSAASATALATGAATNYGAIGVDHDGRPSSTLFERATELGYRTGIVTDSYVWDATPAAFVAKTPVRDNTEAGRILEQLSSSSLELLVGELEDVGEGEVPSWDDSMQTLGAGFTVFGPSAAAADELLRPDLQESRLAAIFEEDQLTDLQSTPNLPRLVQAALEKLSSDPERGFVLLVECEETDSASHAGNFGRLMAGMRSLEATIGVLLEFAAVRGDSLIVFTSDHETGGLTLGIDRNRNWLLRAKWSTTDHTGTVVPLLAYGPGAERFVGSHATWQVGRKLLASLAPPGQGVGEVEVENDASETKLLE